MQVLVNGILFGVLLALAAVGLALIFGVMRIVNLAHGEVIAGGAFFGFFAIGSWGWNLWVALAAALAIGALVGWGVQLALLRTVVGEGPLRSLLLTFGLSMVALGTLSLAFGGDPRRYRAPFSGSLSLFGLTMPRQSLIVAAIAVALFALLIAILFWTKTGAALRATAQHRDAAAACGVNLARTDALAFAISVALAGAAGLLLSLRFVVHPELGQPWLLQSIIVIVLGGMGSLFGAAAGGIVLGIAFTTLAFIYNSTVGLLVMYMLIFALLLFRPHGFAGAEA